MACNKRVRGHYRPATSWKDWDFSFAIVLIARAAPSLEQAPCSQTQSDMMLWVALLDICDVYYSLFAACMIAT